ncbi:MAG: hypothetical protein AAFQ89_03815 [Cyanobacteria bacterium J06626_18]
MNRLPRRAALVRSPLRGRSAVVLPRGQTRHPHLMPVVRRRPPAFRQTPWQIAPKSLWQDSRLQPPNRTETHPTPRTEVQPIQPGKMGQPQKWLVVGVLLAVLIAGIVTFVLSL